MRPLDPVTSKQRAALGLAFFVLFVALWAWATFGGYVSRTFLADPLTMLLNRDAVLEELEARLDDPVQSGVATHHRDSRRPDR